MTHSSHGSGLTAEAIEGRIASAGETMRQALARALEVEARQAVADALAEHGLADLVEAADLDVSVEVNRFSMTAIRAGSP